MRRTSLDCVERAKVSADPFHVQRRGFTVNNKSKTALWVVWCAVCALKLAACGPKFSASEGTNGEAGDDGLAGAAVGVSGAADAGLGGGDAGSDDAPAGGNPSGGSGGTAGVVGGAAGAQSASGGGGAANVGGSAGGAACEIASWRGSTCDTCSSSPETPGQSCAEIIDCYEAHHCGAGCGECEYDKPTSDAAVKVARAVYACRCAGAL